MTDDYLVDKRRSENMAAIRSKNTECELLLRKKLWAIGIRGWRVNTNLKGKPDIVFTKKRIAVFVDGCFWHGCEKCFQMPKTRREYWEPKILRNKERDKEISDYYRQRGWTILRFWEHDVKRNLDDCAHKVAEAVHVSKANFILE